MRVLPRFNLNINKDWIADKVRFNYDGLRRQRLSAPLVRVSNNLIKIEWSRVTNVLKLLFCSFNLINKQLPLTINVGDFIDLETVLTSKKLSSTLGLRSTQQNFDQRFFVSTKKLETNNGCLLIDVNLRLHLPILNLFLRQL